MTSKTLRQVYEQSDAVSHYLSQDRRDQVKIQWEEPFSCAVFKQAIALNQPVPQGKLTVADIGSGTGDGFVLLSRLLSQEPDLCNGFDYWGLDISPAMVATARKLYANTPHVSFDCADIRHVTLSKPVDLYLSCGVPYSHLTRNELHQAIQQIVANVHKHRMRCAVVIDVLGRYSIEWTPQWQEDRWDYCMSFFETEKTQSETLMSFYSHDELRDLMTSAAKSQGCHPVDFAFFDRSIMAGRHTSTKQFNPAISRYRDLINSLMDCSKTTDFSALLFHLQDDAQAPTHILDFFQKFSALWNQLIAEAADLAGQCLSVKPVSLPASVKNFRHSLNANLQTITDRKAQRVMIESRLADALCTLENSEQPGYGVGHDLFGVMWLDATDN